VAASKLKRELKQVRGVRGEGVGWGGHCVPAVEAMAGPALYLALRPLSCHSALA
jgi:hypothetical protein